MDLAKTLNSGYSKASTDRIVDWVGKSPKRLSELVSCLQNKNQRIQGRAAWSLTYCAERNPALITPHLARLVRLLRQKDQPDAVVRPIVRLLQFVEIPTALQGAVADPCLRYLADPSKAPAIRAFAMRVMENLALQNNDLYVELRIILEDQLPYAPPAFVSRAQKIIRRFSETSNQPARRST